MHQRHDIALLGLQSGRLEYRKGRRSRINRKNKRGRKNEMGKRGKRDHQKQKIDLVVEKKSGSETSVYYHIIYQC